MLEKGELVKFTTRGAWVYGNAEKKYESRSPGIILKRSANSKASKFVYTVWWANAEMTREYESFLERVNEHNCD
jgi:hypothetical protein